MMHASYQSKKGRPLPGGRLAAMLWCTFIESGEKHIEVKPCASYIGNL